MKKSMKNISIHTENDGTIVLTQEIHDLNEIDPKIFMSADQAPLVASWVYDAIQANDSNSSEQLKKIPIANFIGTSIDKPDDIEVFLNSNGMVSIQIGEFIIEISPAMAKRLRVQLSEAIRLALTVMLSPDEVG